MKRFLKITGFVILALLVLAFAIPLLFKKQITGLVKKQINQSLVARVDFGDVNLSLFRHFPSVSIRLEDLTVIGTGGFEKDTLLSAAHLDAAANLISVIRGDDIKVSAIELESPRIHALVNKDGAANWDIVKPDTTASPDTDTTTSAFRMSLEKYVINDGYIYYRDETAGMSAEISGLDHSGSGDFTQDIFTLKTKTNAEGASFTYAGIPYLVNTKTGIGADIEINNPTNTYTFKTDEIALNNLRVSTAGFFRLLNDSSYQMDISFKTPSNEFKDILSMIPAIYKNDFDKIKTSGTAALEGFVRGTYSPVQMPAYDLKLDIRDGMFQYPDLPSPVKNIQVAMHLGNKDGLPDNAVVDISRGHFEMENEPFDFRVLFRNPETIRYIDALAKGRVNLDNISRFVKLDAGTKLSGAILADIFAKGEMNALQHQSGNFTAGGFLDIRNLFYSAPSFPQPVSNTNMLVELQNTGGVADNTTIKITRGHAEVGKDAADFNLTIRRPMTVIEFSGDVRGGFNLANVSQFTELPAGTSLAGQLNADVKFAGTKEAIDKGAYDKINTTGTASLTGLNYKSPDYPTGLSVPALTVNFTPANAQITRMEGSYLGSTFTGTANFSNLVGYALKDEPLKGNASIAVDKMNLNDWMGTAPATESTPAPANSEPFLVPANLDILLNAKAGSVVYDKTEYKNISGQLKLANETVELKEVKTEALDGIMTFNGSYSTKTDKKNPAISLSYDVKDIDVQKAFYAFNTFQKLMPVGQFLAGKLNSQLTMTGDLNGNMMPDFTSLTGKGNLLLLEGVLKKFGPLEKLATVLQIDELKSITLKDIRNSIEFANGRVLVKPFTIKVKDIEMQIGGMHGFDQSIDYIIGMKVPRKYIGTQGNNLINGLVTQASNKGIPVKLGETVDLNIKMLGSISNPSIKTDLKAVAGDAVQDLKEQAKDFAQAKIDSAKQTLKDSIKSASGKVLDDLKNQARDRIFGTGDSTQKAVPLDSTKKKAGETIKKTFGDILNRKKKTP